MRLLLVTAVLIAALAGTASAAFAVKPARGCPDSFEFFDRAQLYEMFPDAPPELFDKYDKNRDGLLCGKDTTGDPDRGTFNTVDNTSNRP